MNLYISIETFILSNKKIKAKLKREKMDNSIRIINKLRIINLLTSIFLNFLNSKL